VAAGSKPAMAQNETVTPASTAHLITGTTNPKLPHTVGL
jgi:hypothetical protein